MVATALPFWLQHTGQPMWRSADGDVYARAGRRHPAAVGRTAGNWQAGAPAGLVVETCDVEMVAHHAEAWSDLVARCLESNVFNEPAFALSAARHFAPAHRPSFVLIWDGSAPGRRLLGLCAVRRLKLGFGLTAWTAWSHQQATLAVPLLDRTRAGEALDALLRWCGRGGEGSGLMLHGIDVDGPLGRLLAARGSDRLVAMDRRSRAILRRPSADGASGGPSAKRAKELRRQHRRLADSGSVDLQIASSTTAVRDATELFLDLEARGWKGARHTALLGDPGLAAFTRSMTRLLAKEGKCHIHSLSVDGAPVAMGIVLSSGDRSFFWKTAYDEARAQWSPGKQLAVALTAAQSSRPAIALTDSCAVPDHPMIDRIWADRMMVADMFVAASPSSRFLRDARLIAARSSARKAAKTLVLAVRRLAGR